MFNLRKQLSKLHQKRLQAILEDINKVEYLRSVLKESFIKVHSVDYIYNALYLPVNTESIQFKKFIWGFIKIKSCLKVELQLSVLSGKEQFDRTFELQDKNVVQILITELKELIQ